MNNRKLAVINLVFLFSLFFLTDNCLALSTGSPKSPLPEALDKFDINKEKPALNLNKNYEGIEWEGDISDQKEEFIKVVVDKKGWDELWKRAFDKPAPELDFENYVVACVFLGHDADWLYSIWFDKPYKRDNLLVIPFDLAEIILKLSGPFKASGQYQMKVFKKQQGVEMILENASRYFKKK